MSQIKLAMQEGGSGGPPATALRLSLCKKVVSGMELVQVANESDRKAVPSDEFDRVFTIREVSEELGLTQRAIRFYEEKKLVSPERKGSTRLYSRRDRARLQLVMRGCDIGLSLGEIKEILDLYDPTQGCRDQYQRALQLFERRIALLQEKREEIERQEAALRTSCQQFSSIIAMAAE